MEIHCCGCVAEDICEAVQGDNRCLDFHKALEAVKTSHNSASTQYFPDEKEMKHAASQWIDYLSTIDSTYSDLEQTFIQGVRWGIGQLPGK